MIIPQTVNNRPVTPRGVHLGPYGFFPWADEAEVWRDLLVSMGISWVVVLSESDAFYNSGIPEIFLEAGIIPIVRFAYKFPRPWAHAVDVANLAGLYAQHNAPLIIQFANEPFDIREWENQEVPPEDLAWAIIAQRWNEAANTITEREAFAGFPDGPCYGQNPFSKIGDPNHHWQDGRAVYLGHHYGLGRPLGYPQDPVTMFGDPLSWDQYLLDLDIFAEDPAWNEGHLVLDMMNAQRLAWANPNLTPIQDDTCWRGWEKVLWYADQEFGFPIQIGMTEGGWTPRDRAGANPTDIRWAYTTPQKVAEKTLAMFTAPSPLFAICPWYLASLGGVGWPDEAWVGGAFWEQYGLFKPVVQMLIDNPPGGEVPTPESELELAKLRMTQTRGYLETAIGMNT